MITIIVKYKPKPKTGKIYFVFKKMDKIRIVEWNRYTQNSHFCPIIFIKSNNGNNKKVLPRPGFEPTPAKREQQFGNS